MIGAAGSATSTAFTARASALALGDFGVAVRFVAFEVRLAPGEWGKLSWRAQGVPQIVSPASFLSARGIVDRSVRRPRGVRDHSRSGGAARTFAFCGRLHAYFSFFELAQASRRTTLLL